MSKPAEQINSVIAAFRRLVPKGQEVVIACSGGADSMALLFCAIKANYKVKVIHVVHDMRPEIETQLDKKLVENFCDSIGVPFGSTKVSIQNRLEQVKLALNGNANLENAYRIERDQQIRAFAWLGMNHDKDCYIATGHHADDQLETIIMKICRGTGLRGLTGIAEKVKDQNLSPDEPGIVFVRPMLGITKADAYAICDGNKIPYNEDSTNKDKDYARNALRHAVLPILKKLYPQCSQLSSGLAKTAESAQKVIEETVESLAKYETITYAFNQNGDVIENQLPAISIKIEALRLSEDIVIIEWLRKAFKHTTTYENESPRLSRFNRKMGEQVIKVIRNKTKARFIWPSGVVVVVSSSDVRFRQTKKITVISEGKTVN